MDSSSGSTFESFEDSTSSSTTSAFTSVPEEQEGLLDAQQIDEKICQEQGLELVTLADLTQAETMRAFVAKAVSPNYRLSYFESQVKQEVGFNSLWVGLR
jgi:hypothetical protein